MTSEIDLCFDLLSTCPAMNKNEKIIPRKVKERHQMTRSIIKEKYCNLFNVSNTRTSFIF